MIEIPNICSIIKEPNNKHKYLFQLKKESNEPFLRSIVNTYILPGSSMNSSFTTISFYANSVKSLNTYLQERNRMPYNTAIHMMYYLSKQQTFLEKKSYSFYRISIEDILVVDDSHFICINPTIMEKIENSFIHFKRPFLRTGFCSPEIISIKSLPAQISYKSYYYSLGSLAIFCLFGIQISNHEMDIDNTYRVYKIILYILKPIRYTKLYWLLLKSLCIDIKNRNLLFI